MRSVCCISIIIVFLLNTAPVHSQQLSQIDTTGFDSLLTLLYKKNFLLKEKKENVVQKREELFQNKISFLRNLKLAFQFNNANASDASQDYYTFIPRYGINLQLDFESLITTFSRIRQAKSVLRASEFEFFRSRANLKLELFARFAAFKKALLDYQIELEKSRAVDELTTIAQKKFANGEINISQYSDAIDSQTDARKDLLQSELELQLSKASLLELLEN